MMLSWLDVFKNFFCTFHFHLHQIVGNPVYIGISEGGSALFHFHLTSTFF